MLVCNVSLRPPRSAIAADVAEITAAVDALTTGNVVFATLVDDPASVGDIVDSYLGEIMLEAASANAAVDGAISYSYGVGIDEAMTALDVLDGSIGAPMSAEAAAFLARTSGLDTTHTNAYTALIDGLVADGIWAKLDMLHIYATQNATTANLNLVGNIYNATPVNSPTFTTDRSYTGALTGTKYIATGFTASTAVSPKFTRNSGHVSVWSLNDYVSSTAFIMGSTAGSSHIGMQARYSGNQSYWFLNDAVGMSSISSSSIGHFMCNRLLSTTGEGWKNGVLVASNSSVASQPVNARELFVSGENQNGTPTAVPYEVAMASIGAGLTPTESLAFYNRLRTYMTTVGVP